MELGGSSFLCAMNALSFGLDFGWEFEVRWWTLGLFPLKKAAGWFEALSSEESSLEANPPHLPVTKPPPALRYLLMRSFPPVWEEKRRLLADPSPSEVFPLSFQKYEPWCVPFCGTSGARPGFPHWIAGLINCGFLLFFAVGSRWRLAPHTWIQEFVYFSTAFLIFGVR